VLTLLIIFRIGQILIIIHLRTYASQFETKTPSMFPDAMEEACKIIERVVNNEMRKRARFGLEWGGTFHVSEPGCEEGELIWMPNVAAANCYSGAKENVGFHSDALLVSYRPLSLSTNFVCTDLLWGHTPPLRA
jgi:hypothetical protein